MSLRELELQRDSNLILPITHTTTKVIDVNLPEAAEDFSQVPKQEHLYFT